jgi:chorismate mutase/prephenate dehydratase
VTDQSNDPVVRDLREQIAANDLAIVAAINTRLELVARLKEHKDAHGYARVDQAREAVMADLVARENRGPLSEEGVRSIYRALVELTKRETGITTR